MLSPGDGPLVEVPGGEVLEHAPHHSAELLRELGTLLPAVLDDVVDEVHGGELPAEAQALQVLVPHPHHHSEMHPVVYAVGRHGLDLLLALPQLGELPLEARLGEIVGHPGRASLKYFS